MSQTTKDKASVAFGGATSLPPVASTSTSHHHHHSHHPHRSFRGAGHRRAKSAGNASILRDFSHYAATGLYAHQSGERLEQSALYTAASAHHYVPQMIKKTSSENTLRFERPYHSSSEAHPSVRYSSSLKGRANEASVSASGSATAGTVAVVSGSGSANLDYLDKDEQMLLEPEEECGCFNLRCFSLQRFACIQFFVFLCCVLVTLQQALSSGYFNSVITTIEKRFDISSQMSGAIVSTFELGNLLTIIFVSYFGTHRHIPRWIGTGIVVTAIGSLIFAVPHFMSITNPFAKRVNSSDGSLINDAANTCKIPKPALSSPFLEKASQFIQLGNLHEDPTCVEETNYNAPQMLVFMLAMVLIGCGGTPIFTLGTTYIDDHVPKESASMYMGCMYSMVAFGLVCGFLLGGYFINVHENAFGTGITPKDIFPGHPKWIGAWWAGFILLGILLLVVAVPFFLFPKSLKRKRLKRASEEQEVLLVVSSQQQTPLATSSSGQVFPVANNAGGSGGGSSKAHSSQAFQADEPIKSDAISLTNVSTGGAKKYGRKLGDIPSCMWRLATNPVYMITTLGSCMELAIVSGFLIFLPKYLETQFSLGKSQANLFAGGIAIPGACFGIFLGGYLLKRLQLSPKGAIQLVMFFNLVCMGLYTALYFLGCENVRMAGTTLPYANSSQFDNHFRVNLTSDCNLGCRCSSNDLEPVCDIRNKISYYSPCFAGCTSVDNSRNIQNYSNCACLPGDGAARSDVTIMPLVTPGPCPQLCTAMLPFMVLLFVITLVVSITQMPVVMITLRSVAEEERSLALGMQFVLFRVFGYIPAPIVFGNVIDSTCLVYKAHCGQQGGFCLLYNIEQFRLRYVGVCSSLKVAAGLLFFLDWLLICYREKRQLRKKALKVFTADELVSSIISLDRLSVFGTLGGATGGWGAPETIAEIDEEQQPLGALPDSDYNSTMDEEDDTTCSASSLPMQRLNARDKDNEDGEYGQSHYHSNQHHRVMFEEDEPSGSRGRVASTKTHRRQSYV